MKALFHWSAALDRSRSWTPTALRDCETRILPQRQQSHDKNHVEGTCQCRSCTFQLDFSGRATGTGGVTSSCCNMPSRCAKFSPTDGTCEQRSSSAAMSTYEHWMGYEAVTNATRPASLQPTGFSLGCSCRCCKPLGWSAKMQERTGVQESCSVLWASRAKGVGWWYKTELGSCHNTVQPASFPPRNASVSM